MRDKSKVMVKVLDLAPLEQKVVELLRTKNEKYTKCMTNQTWAIVETKNGIYALGNEGVGPNHPITKDNQLDILWVGGGEDFYDMLPSIKTNIDDEDLRSYFILEDKNLSDFVRVFGPRLESNFREWNSFLEPII
jgi:hypothetical protein